MAKHRQVNDADEALAKLPDGAKEYIRQYLDDPIIVEPTQDEMIRFIKSGIGMKIVALIIQYGKICAKERIRSMGRSQEKIEKIRSILGM